MKRLLATVALTLLVAASLWYISAPPKGADGFRSRTAHAAEALRSQVQSTRILSGALGDGRLTEAAALVGLEEAEQGATSTAATLEAYEAPPETLELRRRFVALAGETTEALAALRIAAQAESWDRIAELSEPLPDLAERLAALEREAAA